MKVITQLVQHFWQRNALTADQAEYLVNQGFVRASDLPGFEYAEPSDKQPSSFKFKVPVKPPHPLEGDEEKLRAKGPSKRGRGKAAIKSLSEKDLAKLVEKEFASRAAALESLRRWAVPLGKADTWDEAAVRVRQAADARVLDVLRQSLRRNTIDLKTLWTALDIEPLHQLIDDEEVHVALPRAFRAALTTDGPLAAPHVFLLKHGPIVAAKSLGEAQRRIAAAVFRLNHAEPKTISTALANGNHPVVYWSLVLVYCARRRPMNGPTRLRKEYAVSELPPQPIWNQAWTVARHAEPAAVTALLEQCYPLDKRLESLKPLECELTLHCPLDWRAP